MNQANDRIAWLRGGIARCAVQPHAPKKTSRLVLLGAPGVGKGTQAELLCARSGACHLSTGDVFRAAKCLRPGERSPALDHAFTQMHRGELVSDETVLAIVSERVNCLRCLGGFVLDGFPRTVMQALALEKVLQTERLQLTGVLNYELPIDEIVTRLSGRRTCSACKAVFHTRWMSSRVDGVCDHCGGRLFQREDDRTEAIEVRMKAYDQATRPLIEFYRERALLISIVANGTPDEIFARSKIALDAADSAVCKDVVTAK